ARVPNESFFPNALRAFLKESEAAPDHAFAASKQSPIGDWKFRADHGEKSLEGKAAFRKDGTFVLNSPDHPLEGRFAYANGVLWLIGADGFASGSPAWHDKDQFSVKLGETE